MSALLNPHTISVEQAACMLGISRASAYAAARRGDFPTIKLGRLVRVPRPAFEALFAPKPTTAAKSA